MSLDELYKEVILDHYKNPRNKRDVPGAGLTCSRNNPLCGDRLTVYLKLDGDTIETVKFEGSGCAISKASASLMTEALKGKTREEAEALFRCFHQLLTDEAEPTGESRRDLGKLEVLAGVREFPMRVKCATLAWHTFRAAVDKSQETVSTE